MAGLRKNQIITVTICGYSSDGAGVARHNGFVIFVVGAIDGEICDIRLLKVLKNMAYAKIEKLHTPSKNRIDPICPNYRKCGGCNFLHMNYEEELRVKKGIVLSALQKIGGIDLHDVHITGSDNIYAYRNKAQYFVDKFGNVGFYRARSHDLCKIERCHIQDVRADACAHALEDWIAKYEIKPYDEGTGRGYIRGLLVRTGRGGVHATVISTVDNIPSEHALIKRMLIACPEICGLVLNVNNTKGNVILGKKNRTLWGEPALRDKMCSLDFDISPNSFYQINRPQAEKLYMKALEYAQPDGKILLDLYCGIGTISLLMARFAKKVTGAEIIPAAIANASNNASINSIHNTEFVCADAGDISRKLAEKGESPDIIIVDPPRKGLSVDVIDSIKLMAPSKFVYISCNPATLARDLKLIVQDGTYHVNKVEAFDMFPRCAHVETVVLISKEYTRQ